LHGRASEGRAATGRSWMIKRTGVLAAGVCAAAAFALAGCGGDDTVGVTTGTLEVLLTMEGADQDPNGGILYLDGESLGALSVNLRKTEEVENGIHVVRVAGINANCTPLLSAERNVTIRSGQSASVEFSYLCESTEVKDPGGDPVE
jgi:hypothetical protein